MGSGFTIEKNVTINLNGHTLTFAAYNNGSGNAVVKGANVTFTNGSLNLASNTGRLAVDSSEKASTLTIANDVKVNATYGTVSAINVMDATNTTVVNVNGDWKVKNEIVSCSNGKDEKLTVNLNATVKATDLQSNFLIAVDAGTSTVNVLGGTYTSNKAAFDVKNGTLNIKGGTITAKGDNAILVHEAGNDADGEPYNAVLNVTGGEIIATAEGKYSVYFQTGSGKTTGAYKISGGNFTSGKDAKGNQLPALYINDPEFLDNHAKMISGGSFTSAIVGDVTVGDTVYKKAAAAAAILTGNATTTTENGVVTVNPSKAEDDKKPAAKPDEEAPNTYDAGLVYMGLALSRYGCAILLSVVTVSAACYLPTDDPVVGQSVCEALYNGQKADTAEEAFVEAVKNGGTVEILGEGKNLNVQASSYTISKNVTILANDNDVNFASTITITVADKGSLTITGAKLTAGRTIIVNKGGNLALNNVTSTTGGTLVNNSGTTVVTGGTFTATGSAALFVNNGSLTLNGLTVTAKATMANVASHNTTTVINGGAYDVHELFATPSSASSATTTAANISVKDSKVAATSGNAIRGKSVVTFDNSTFTVSTGDAFHLYEGSLTINSGKVVSSSKDAVEVSGTAEATLTITGGTLESTTGGYALSLTNPNATYAISGGEFNSKATNRAAMFINAATKVDDKVTVAKAYQGILTGGKYLNNIIATVTIAGINYDVSNQLVADGYTVKEEGDYKVVVSTKAENDKKPAAKPEEQAPNTYDAGLV